MYADFCIIMEFGVSDMTVELPAHHESEAEDRRATESLKFAKDLAQIALYGGGTSGTGLGVFGLIQNNSTSSYSVIGIAILAVAILIYSKSILNTVYKVKDLKDDIRDLKDRNKNLKKQLDTCNNLRS
jgi:hypothetical protein